MISKALAAVCLFLISAITMAQLPPVPPELKEFDYLIGSWSGKMKWTMDGQTMEGGMTMKVEKDGMFYKQTTVTEAGGMKMTEVGYLGWDAKKKKYSFHSFTNFSPIPRIEWGEIKDGKAIFVSEPWDGGMTPTPIVGRGTIVRQGADIVFTLEFKNGEKWDKAGEALLKKG